MLPSFKNEWANNQFTKPRIQVLEIRHRDRPDAEPVAWLLTEREETYRHAPQDGTLLEASINIFYQQITTRYSWEKAGEGFFSGYYSNRGNSVSLTSSSYSTGGVFLNLPGLDGQRIGTYLMNEIVQWVQRWPDAIVKSVDLVSGQGGEDNKERRNRFYEQFGLVFDYTDADHREGRSRPMRAGELTSVETWKKNIIQHRMFDYLADTLYAAQRASSELVESKRCYDTIRADLRQAEAQPIRWALKMLYYQYGKFMAMGIILTLVAVVVWLG